jgi:hypothetical protein
MQRAALILRYGIGPVHVRTGSEAARLLDVSRGRVRLLERRGVRALAGIGGGAACADTGVATTTLIAVYDLLTDTPSDGSLDGLPAPLEAGVRLANAGAVALEDGDRGAVAGVRESGHEQRAEARQPEEDGPAASAGPSLGDPFEELDPRADNPLLIVLLAIVVACLVSAAREIKRAVR